MGHIYKTINKINGKFYIGKSKKSNKNYLGSGILIRTAIKKYGKENFRKEVIEEDVEDLLLNDREMYWIRTLKSNDRNIGYNITEGGDGGDTITLNPNRQEIINRCSDKNNPFYGRHHSEETKKMLSDSNTGKIRTDDVKKQISKTLKQKYQSGEIVKIHSIHQRKLQSKMMKENNPLKRPEIRKRVSKKMLTEINPSTKWWIFERVTGEKYRRFSFKQTCKEFELSYGTMRKWIGKDRFSESGWKVYEDL